MLIINRNPADFLSDDCSPTLSCAIIIMSTNSKNAIAFGIFSQLIARVSKLYHVIFRQGAIDSSFCWTGLTTNYNGGKCQLSNKYQSTFSTAMTTRNMSKDGNGVLVCFFFVFLKVKKSLIVVRVLYLAILYYIYVLGFCLFVWFWFCITFV